MVPALHVAHRNHRKNTAVCKFWALIGVIQVEMSRVVLHGAITGSSIWAALYGDD